MTNPALRAQVRPFADYRSYRYTQLARPPASLATMPNEILSQIHGYLPPAAQSAMRRVSRQMYPLPRGEYPYYYSYLVRNLRGVGGSLAAVCRNIETGTLFIALFHPRYPGSDTIVCIYANTVDSVAGADVVLARLPYFVQKFSARYKGHGIRVYSTWYDDSMARIPLRVIAQTVRVYIDKLQQQYPYEYQVLTAPIDLYDEAYK